MNTLLCLLLVSTAVAQFSPAPIGNGVVPTRTTPRPTASTTRNGRSTIRPGCPWPGVNRTITEIIFDLMEVNSTFLQKAAEISMNLNLTTKQKNDAYIQAYQNLPAQEKTLAEELGRYYQQKITKAVRKLRMEIRRFNPQERQQVEEFLRFAEDENKTGRQIIDEAIDVFDDASARVKKALDEFFTSMY